MAQYVHMKDETSLIHILAINTSGILLLFITYLFIIIFVEV